MLYTQIEGGEYQGRRYYGVWMDGSTNLYIFDENLNYLETRSLDKNFIRSRNEIVLDGYTADRSLRIVAWGQRERLGGEPNRV